MEVVSLRIVEDQQSSNDVDKSCILGQSAYNM